MRSFLFIALAIVSVVSAQSNLNWKGQDTAQITSWKADSLFISKTFILSNAENKLLAFQFDDTAAAGRAADSVNAEIGYQLGTLITKLFGGFDTLWTDIIPIDTCNTQTVANMYSGSTAKGGLKWVLDSTIGGNTRPHGAIDTSIGTNESAMWIPFTPYWSPYVRFTVQGLTSNKKFRFIRARLSFQQRGYVYVRQM